MQARHRTAFSVMGTTASIHVNDDISDDDFRVLTYAVQSELERLEQMFSVYRPSSEISRINAGELNLLDASQEVVDVLDACTWMEQVSNNSVHDSSEHVLLRNQPHRIREGLGGGTSIAVVHRRRYHALVSRSGWRLRDRWWS